MSVPRKDTELVAWSTNFNTRIVASPTTFGLDAGQAAAYTPLHEGFLDAWNAMNTPGARSKALVTAKDTAKAALLVYARELYGFVQSNTTVSDSDKDLVGVTVRKFPPSPIPVPDAAPAIDIVKVSGRTVTVRLHDADNASKRGKPAGVQGAAVFSYVGNSPASDPADFKFEGNTTKTFFDITFPLSVEPGAVVWITASWFNYRAEAGPGATPISTNIQFGSSMAA